MMLQPASRLRTTNRAPRVSNRLRIKASSSRNDAGERTL
jgi:hypothetical protein